MPAIATIGAGPGLGAATARRFGREGFGIALIARTPDKLDRLREELAPDALAARLWNIHTQRGEFRVTVRAETA